MATRSQTLRRLQSYATFALDTFLLRRERPYLFILVINDQCNLDCFYCSTKNMGLYDLDEQSARQALSEAYSRGHRALVLTGGEPMLWRSGEHRIAEIVSFARELGFLDIAVFTNGTFPLDLEGLTFIVTIDGTREAHNTIRGGTYGAILSHVREAKSKVLASITISKANVRDLEEAVRQIAATHLFHGITFNLLTHNPEVVARYGLLGQERRDVLNRIWRLKRDGFPILFSQAAYRAMLANRWKRPVRQIELFVGNKLFTCCRDVGNPDICRDCGYSSCVEVAQAVGGHPSAILQLMQAR